MGRKNKSPIQRFLAQPEGRKEAEYAECEQKIPLSRSRPLSAAERRLWRKAIGRPTVGAGAGAEAVSVTIERGLLERANRYAKRHNLNRSQLIAEGLELVMQRAS